MFARNALRKDSNDPRIVRCSASLCVAALSRSDAITAGPLGYGSTGLCSVDRGLLVMVAAMGRKDRTLLVRLREALKAKELTVAYQPIVDLNSGRVVTAEAIVSWTDQAGTTIPPDIFLSAAEEAGTAGTITTYVLRTVASQTGPFLRENRAFGITVNIVVADLGDGGFYAALKGQYVMQA